MEIFLTYFVISDTMIMEKFPASGGVLAILAAQNVGDIAKM